MAEEINKEDPIEAIKRRNEDRARRLKESLVYGDFGLGEEAKPPEEAGGLGEVEVIGAPIPEPQIGEIPPPPIPTDSLSDHLPGEIVSTPVGEEEAFPPEKPSFAEAISDVKGAGEYDKRVEAVTPPPPEPRLPREKPPEIPPPPTAVKPTTPKAPPEERFELPSLEELGFEGLEPSFWGEEPPVRETVKEPPRKEEKAPPLETAPIEVEGPKIGEIKAQAAEVPPAKKTAPPAKKPVAEPAVTAKAGEEELRQLMIEIIGSKVKIGRKNLTMSDAIDLMSLIVEKYKGKK
jgi:hypothetical protein